MPLAPDCRLYLITPPALPDLAAFGEQLAQALDAGDVAALQIRLKDASDADIGRAVEALAPIAQARGVAGKRHPLFGSVAPYKRHPVRVRQPLQIQ